ncbi:acyl dehydratase [Ilumatobacter sp.]|uniref:acyl dehydratase n=1 Tax=Ilumatobacter sp. TaxID=1967498 RepID=UPI003C60807F
MHNASDSLDGPFYDEVSTGYRFPVPPSCTLTSGDASTYRSICGEHWAPGLDHRLATLLTGDPRPLAHPGLVVAMAIGASTVATRRVVANLFYRDLTLTRPVRIGETLTTATEIRALSDASRKPGAPARGKMLLGITTTADDDVVLAFERCALLPCRGDSLPGHGDDIGSSSALLDLARYEVAVPHGWDLSLLGERDEWQVGERRTDALRDVVDGATALVRLTHNLAAVHRDQAATASGRRLVYGGHTVALAQASLERSMPTMATLLGWHECNHTAPVHEGDLLEFEHELIAQRASNGGQLRAVNVTVTAHRPGADPSVVLDWTPVVVSA